ncbi:MAG: hypothetical protein FVQ77_02820 [Cytophagales bacterium]|nr:hypothetical protein [Cytophagales bacterium]
MIEIMRNIFQFRELFTYFIRVFQKDKTGKYPSSIYIRMMHGINRIAIVVFILGMVFFIIKMILR